MIAPHSATAKFANRRQADIVRDRGFMRSSCRKAVTFLAIAAIAASNCFAAPAVAAHHPAPTVSMAADHPHGDHEHGDHAHGDHAGHSADPSSSEHAGHKSADGGDPSSVCCTSMTCAAVGVIAAQSDTAMPSLVLPSAAALDDAVRTTALGTLDPPPRTN
jgi:hypothetical protein